MRLTEPETPSEENMAVVDVQVCLRQHPILVRTPLCSPSLDFCLLSFNFKIQLCVHTFSVSLLPTCKDRAAVPASVLGGAP